MEHDLTKLARELFESTEPQKDTTETPKPILLQSILPSLPPEGQAWLNGLNPFCRRAVEHDLRVVGPELFVLGASPRYPAKTRTRLRPIR